MIAVTLVLALGSEGGRTGCASGAEPDGGAGVRCEAPTPDPIDGGTPETIELQGIQVALIADANTPGHRPVVGAVDDAELDTWRQRKSDRLDYEDFLAQRTADLSSCASWSPDGRAVKGWLSVEWVVGPDGAPSRFKVLQNDLDSPLVERCMLREMAAWRFDPPPGSELLLRHNFYLMLPARPELTPLPAP